MIFGTLNLDKSDVKILQICPPHLSDVATLPWEIQQSHFQRILFIHTFDYLRYLRSKQTNCNSLAHPTWKCHHTNLWIEKLFQLTEGLLRSFKRWSSEESQLWVVVGGSEKNRLWCVATGMSGKQCHSKCSEWPPSALIHVSSLFRHWSVAQYTTMCWNSAHVATSRCHKPQHVCINTCAPPVACPRRSISKVYIWPASLAIYILRY